MKGKHVSRSIPENNYLGNTEDFRRDQVVFWFCADYWFSVTFYDQYKYDIKPVANLTMYKSFDVINLKYHSGDRGYLKWDVVKGHPMMQEHEMPWRTNPKSQSNLLGVDTSLTIHLSRMNVFLWFTELTRYRET